MFQNFKAIKDTYNLTERYTGLQHILRNAISLHAKKCEYLENLAKIADKEVVQKSVLYHDYIRLKKIRLLKI